MMQLGPFKLNNPFLLAPMASICHAPFRLFMQDQGCELTVSELISADGLFFRNEKTMDMLKIHPKERNVGIQIFGDDPERLLDAALLAQDHKASFIDINMGCPVRKVVTKGGGSALLKTPSELYKLLYPLRSKLSIPLTIKIRTGWDKPNAHEVVRAAYDAGVSWVAIHGRTRTQQYKGRADWDYIENLAQSAPLPIIGNGDLHSSESLQERWEKTNCKALMIARGCLKDPFIFKTPLKGERKVFLAEDYFRAIEKLFFYMEDHFPREKTILIQMKKMIHWFSAGFPGSVKFRQTLFPTQNLEDLKKNTEDFFMSRPYNSKHVQYESDFLSSGHG